MNNRVFFLTFGFVFSIVLFIFICWIDSPRSTQASEEANVFLPVVLSKSGLTEPPDEYIVIGWSDLGMHYYDQDYSVFSILPPYNTIWAQVIRIGDPPQIVTDTVKVEYHFPDNSESASKTNFWNYEDKLFDVELAPNVGLKGAGLSGELALGDDGTYFIVEGIPLTEYRDSNPSTAYPYQLAELVVKDAISNAVLAETTIVAPVSSEVNCYSCKWHDDRRDILDDHDKNSGTHLIDEVNAGNPILCASCHADPIIEEAGDPARLPLSITIHKTHGNKTNDCYDCHPGDQTQYYRDVMSQLPIGLICTDCHGTVSDIGNESRTPWADLPRCQTCHADHAENPGTLFRYSIGHGGMYCQACHNSTHAILPSREGNDNLQSIALQGFAGQISECTVCHKTEPPSGGPHTP